MILNKKTKSKRKMKNPSGQHLVKIQRNDTIQVFKWLGEKIRKNRKMSKLTQIDLAERLNLKQPYLAAVEKGKKNIELKTLLKIARSLNCVLYFDLVLEGELETFLNPELPFKDNKNINPYVFR